MTVISQQGVFYDEKAHTYHTLHNDRLVSNTEVLGGMGFFDYSKIPEKVRMVALEIGTDVHRATALLDRGLRWKEKFSHLAGWVSAWQQFKKEFKFKAELIEEPLHDPAYLVATTPDRYGNSIHGKIVVQIKTGTVEDWVGLQLAFEERCIILAREGRIVTQSTSNRFGVWLRPDGTYKPRRFEEPGDIRVFLGAASVFQWQRKHNGRKHKTNGG